MRFFKKFLVRIAAIAVTVLCSGSVLAQSYVMKTAFVGEPGLKKFVVGKLFDEFHIVPEDDTGFCGIRLTTPTDSILYRFRSEALNTELRECNVVFMVVDFSSPKANLRDILIRDFNEIMRASEGRSKVILIAMNAERLSPDDLKQFNSARRAYGRNNFDYILTSFGEDDEAFRNRLFEVTERMIDWRRLPPSVESNRDIISRLTMLKMMASDKFDKNALIAEVIRQQNETIAMRQSMTAAARDREEFARDIVHLKLTVEELNSIRDLQSRLNGLTQSVVELSAFLHGMSEGRPFNDAEARHICDRIDASMRNLGIDEQDGSADGEELREEIKNLRHHIRELRQIVAENRAAINVQEQLMTRFQSYTDEERAVQESLLADRTAWLQKAAKIDHSLEQLKNAEKYIRTICEGKIEDFDWEQYQECGRFGKWLIEQTRPHIKKRARRRELAEELKKLDEDEKRKTPEKGSDKGEKQEKSGKESDEGKKQPKKD